ncbi:HRDC domain-containing protein [Mariniluteicoccus flavus]
MSDAEESPGADAVEVPEAAELPVLAAPADGVPPVVDTPEALAATIESLRSGTGPVAVDAERAHGFRYSTRAYLLQLRREGSGTHLVDPVAFRDAPSEADLSALGEAIADAEWIIHAATQDTPCLVQVRMVPTTIFDTELAGRLLGLPRVGLGALIEHYFGLRLLKEHSAADWSTRPLPDSWLAYAALDVELLIELRNLIEADLERAGKDGWAREEFAHLVEKSTRPTVERVDPWRRLSGIHGVRTPAGMAVARELWHTRDEIARRLDRSPGKILQDKAISEVAGAKEPGRGSVRAHAGFQRRAAKRYEANWIAAIERAQALTKKELPPVHLAPDGPPPPRTWENKDPVAHGRFLRLRETINELATEHDLPAENLLTPDTWRRLAWKPPARADEAAVDAFLIAHEARDWQRGIVVGPLTAALED